MYKITILHEIYEKKTFFLKSEFKATFILDIIFLGWVERGYDF